MGALPAGGEASRFFGSLLPHPLVSRPPLDWRWRWIAQHEGITEWHPLLGHYQKNLRHGEPRPLPTFAADELTVYFLGGSTVRGFGASRREATIAGRTEHYLRTQIGQRFKIMVINEGIEAYMSTAEMILFVTKILPFGNPLCH